MATSATSTSTSTSTPSSYEQDGKKDEHPVVHNDVYSFFYPQFVAFVKACPLFFQRDLEHLFHTALPPEERIPHEDPVKWLELVEDPRQSFVVLLVERPEKSLVFPLGMSVVTPQRFPSSGLWLNVFVIADNRPPRIGETSLDSARSLGGRLFFSTWKLCKFFYSHLENQFSQDMEEHQQTIQEDPTSKTAQREKQLYNRQNRRHLQKMRQKPQFICRRLLLGFGKSSSEWKDFVQSMGPSQSRLKANCLRYLPRKEWVSKKQELNDGHKLRLHEDEFLVIFACF